MTRNQLILVAAFGSAAMLLGAWGFQAFGYAPCKMCLWQRWPHAAAFLIGLVALPAGRLGDVWSGPGMMVIYFIGMGAAAIACGLVSAPPSLMIGLAGIGLFGAIYHPIGIPWMIRNAPVNLGKILAVNGIFGSLGSAAAGLIAGILDSLARARVARSML